MKHPSRDTRSWSQGLTKTESYVRSPLAEDHTKEAQTKGPDLTDISYALRICKSPYIKPALTAVMDNHGKDLYPSTA